MVQKGEDLFNLIKSSVKNSYNPQFAFISKSVRKIRNFDSVKSSSIH